MLLLLSLLTETNTEAKGKHYDWSQAPCDETSLNSEENDETKSYDKNRYCVFQNKLHWKTLFLYSTCTRTSPDSYLNSGIIPFLAWFSTPKGIWYEQWR